ncbi:MAG TPA: hypothetical protein VMU22_12610 [Rhizomicrobium sp.]|nr:hypothetical protein [Rhizomicrobium sp.]
MHAFAAAGAAFLLAVLWFDLMFDVQAAGVAGEILPAEILASMSFYYRRVTTEARPMNIIVPSVMVLTLGAIAAEVLQHDRPFWVGTVSLLMAASAIALPFARTVRNAVALGKREGSPRLQTRRARLLFRDHLFCMVAMTVVLTLQLASR